MHDDRREELLAGSDPMVARIGEHKSRRERLTFRLHVFGSKARERIEARFGLPGDPKRVKVMHLTVQLGTTAAVARAFSPLGSSTNMEPGYRSRRGMMTATPLPLRVLA